MCCTLFLEDIGGQGKASASQVVCTQEISKSFQSCRGLQKWRGRTLGASSKGCSEKETCGPWTKNKPNGSYIDLCSDLNLYIFCQMRSTFRTLFSLSFKLSKRCHQILLTHGATRASEAALGSAACRFVSCSASDPERAEKAFEHNVTWERLRCFKKSS